MTEHALLSASGSERWLKCTKSARLEEQLPDTESAYALEGTLAHAVGELKLRKQFTEPMGARAFKSRMKKLIEDEQFSSLDIDRAELDRHTDTYLEYVSALALNFVWRPYVALERKVDFSAYAPEGFGTCDCILLAGKDLHIMDFKYGKGVKVYADRNTQMMLYALGAYRSYSLLYPIETITMHIIQPRIDNIDSATIGITELLEWGESINPIAKAAFDGIGEYVAGEHCKFCKAKAKCRTRAAFNLALEEYKKPADLLTDAEVGEILKRAVDLQAWAKALEEYALTACLNGQEIPGYKAVHGRSNRMFSNIDAAFEKLKANGIKEEMLYKRVPATLTEVEKILGAKDFKALLTEYITKSEGKPTLVPETDGRDAITNKITAQEAFKELKETNEHG